MKKYKENSTSDDTNQTRLKELTRWSKHARSRERTNYNTSNVINHQPKISKERLNQALLDYTSGNFQSKEEVAIKHKISTQTLIKYARLRDVVNVSFI
ncbi:hypothetical protein CWO17_11555 [Vibrio sp. 10N.286.45.A3]|uniref:hypothetical protein n=1 Tax=Vibrio TaxID=662 RepID=UPI000C129FB6|nr:MULTISPECIES: hypothetical protein [Vibrio]PTP05050.1 hypothetical protein CWO17_11555 [Vibrio sp. 10N.286.45.A3]TKE77788.1 hypothetical protein FCV56_18580 [Vibrio sp. F12]TKE93142.1 hypothetical protein FCV61_21800 [Vibrio sp. F12]